MLVQAKWDQIEPYNYWVPKKDGVRCPAGCVATAMGMILHYWKYPEVGGNDNNSIATCSWNGQNIKYKFKVDSNKFEFDKMPKELSYTSSYDEIRAVGKLLFACGVTVKMHWDPEGSGAHSEDVPAAFSNWFRYSTDATYLNREEIVWNQYTRQYQFRLLVPDDQWLAILHSEIDDHARPVYYSGTDLVIGFKSSFLIEILGNMSCETVVLKFADARRAALIVPSEEEAENEKICGILMPIMVS